MRLRFLGTGTSYGVPMIGCRCGVCISNDPRNRRLRSSLLVDGGGGRWLVDAGPDLRAQLLAAGVDRLSGVFLTHFHSDHVMGLDDLRAVTDRMEHPLPVWAPRRDADALRTSFPHLFGERRGRGATAFLDLRPVGNRETVRVGADSVRALEVPHGRGWSTGWVFGRRLAYFTDLSEMPPDVRAEVRGVEVLVLDMLREEPHPTHLDLARSLEIVRDCTPGTTFFIHMSHEVDHATTAAKLPEGSHLATDELVYEWDSPGASPSR